MTNEQKLKRLLEVANKNGWASCDDDIFSDLANYNYKLSNVSIDTKSLAITAYDEKNRLNVIGSINDLVTKFEWNEKSFLEALSDAMCAINADCVGFLSLLQGYATMPTSERLDWLFDTFDHLI